MNRLVVCLVIISLAPACATQYQPRGATGGFTETRLGPEADWVSFNGDRRTREAYRVSFNGNRRTSISRATDFTLLRCAELTLQNEFTHFVITEESQWTKDEIIGSYEFVRGGQSYQESGAFEGPGPIERRNQSPRSTKTIYMLNTTDGIDAEVFDATFIVNSLKTKYSIE